MSLKMIQSVVEQLEKEIVICDMNHTIIYMNKFAVENYASRFGRDLIGKNLLDCHNVNSCKIIEEKLDFAIKNNLNSILITDRPEKGRKSYITLIRDEHETPIGYYERYEGNAF